MVTKNDLADKGPVWSQTLMSPSASSPCLVSAKRWSCRLAQLCWWWHTTREKFMACKRCMAQALHLATQNHWKSYHLHTSCGTILFPIFSNIQTVPPRQKISTICLKKILSLNLIKMMNIIHVVYSLLDVIVNTP